MDDDSGQVIIRAPSKDDKSVITETWTKNQYYSDPHFGQMSFDLYKDEFKKQISKILMNPNTKIEIAAFKESPDLVIGYVIYAGPVLHWIYVKKDYRNKRVATLLMQGKEIHTVTSSTKMGSAISRKQGWAFNPLIIGE